MRRLWAVLAVAAVTVTGAVSAVEPAAAVQVPQGGVVSAVPSAFTPNVLDGDVLSIVQVGSMIVMGGEFTQVEDVTTGQVFTRNNLVAFNATTGAVSTTFVPNPSGKVEVVIPAADNRSVYVGGYFNTISGITSRSLARIAVADGAPVSGFKAPAFGGGGRIKDLRLSDNRLWLAGTFTTVAGVAQPYLATVNATSGAYDAYMNLAIAGTHNGGVSNVSKIDITPDGERLIAIGNFRTLAGATNDQFLMLNIAGASAAPANWQTNFFAGSCAFVFDAYVRDLDFSPDGEYFVVTTTGAYGGSESACDTTARFETGNAGTGQVPTWRAYTGGDTHFAAAVTDAAVYIGGHFRWENNPYGNNVAAAGAVDRVGLAALDPRNGMPLDWNPGRSRGVGVFDLLATSTGLWVGSDTDRVANRYHARIAYFPLAGGAPLVEEAQPTLPASVYVAANDDSLAAREFTGTAVTGSAAAPAGGIDWSNVRGSFMVNGDVYLTLSNGDLVRRTFDGTTWGTAEAVNTSDLLVRMSSWHSEAASMGGMAFDSDTGRLYYQYGSSLYYRSFSPTSGVVGSARFTAPTVSGISYLTMRDMFIADGYLYWSTSTGALMRAQWQAGAAVAGTVETVTAGQSWTAPTMFVEQMTGGANQAPTADIAVSCDGLECSFDGSGSIDPELTKLTYRWTFGDGKTATGAQAAHTYTAAGDYDVTLTVTDAAGATGSTTQTVHAAAVQAEYIGGTTATVNGTNITMTLPSSVEAGDVMVATVVSNVQGATFTAPAGWQQAVADSSSTGVAAVTWTKVATGGDAGAQVTMTGTVVAKSSLTLGVYRGVDTADPVADAAISFESTQQADHTAASVAAVSGSLLLNIWADKSSATTTWSVPDDVTARQLAVGTGSGRIVAQLADSGPLGAGATGTRTATANSANAKAVMISIALRPKP